MKAIRRLLGTVELGLRTINLDAALFRAEHTLCTPEQRRTAQSACGNSADPDQAVFNAGQTASVGNVEMTAAHLHAARIRGVDKAPTLATAWRARGLNDQRLSQIPTTAPLMKEDYTQSSRIALGEANWLDSQATAIYNLSARLRDGFI